MKIKAIFFIFCFLALTGCTLSIATPTSTETSDHSEAVVSTLPLVSTNSPAAPVESTETAAQETAEPSAEPFEPFTAVVWANQVNLRTNPGYLFPSLLQLKEGDEITVLAKAPGSEWLYAQLPDETTGWVFKLLVQLEGVDISRIPVREPVEVQAIKGTLRTKAGVPINGVQFSLTQVSAGEEQRNDAVTDETGTFVAFMPLNTAGEWTVAYAAISCTSIVHDSACNTRPEYAGTVKPELQTVNLPYSGVLEFIWK